ncbi:MAG: hypothetical protein L6R42_000836 [Xanthoria sp. 1 TBL-2021]|nr:MAG: hypothetical protein L6R42_000836 [Xanthoria sp. 1 TBL-2021]
MDFQPESIAALMDKDAAEVRASYRKITTYYEAALDELDLANKKIERLQRKSEEPESELFNADKRATALSGAGSELEQARSKIATLESALEKKESAIDPDGEHRYMKWRVAVLESTLERKNSDLVICRSIMKGIQPYLTTLEKKSLQGSTPQSSQEAKYLIFQDGKVTKSEDVSASVSSLRLSFTNPVQDTLTLLQPWVEIPRGVIASNQDSWGPFPRNWMNHKNQERFAEELLMLETPKPTMGNSKSH